MKENDLQKVFDKMDDYCVPIENCFFRWSKKGCGFGTLSFYFKDGKLICDNDHMNKDFVKKLLCDMVDSSEIDKD